MSVGERPFGDTLLDTPPTPPAETREQDSRVEPRLPEPRERDPKPVEPPEKEPPVAEPPEKEPTAAEPPEKEPTAADPRPAESREQNSSADEPRPEGDRRSPDDSEKPAESRSRRSRRGRRRKSGGARAPERGAQGDADDRDPKDPTASDGGGEGAAPAKRARIRKPSRGKPAEKQVLIDALDPSELRLVVLESDVLEELHFERTADRKLVGNIYKGRVVNLEPAIQAAFVEIGIGRNGFLHVSDVLPIYAAATGIPIDSLSKRPGERKRLLIQDVLRKGQEVLVQIAKDPLGAKGPSLTTYVSIPGKYLVLMPGVSRFGVSKRIQDGVERAKLRESLSSLDPPKGLGYIVRTAGKDKPAEVLKKDLEGVVGTWQTVRDGVENLPCPRLLYEESDLLTRALRDICGPEVDEIVVNDPDSFRQVEDFVAEVMPSWEGRARLYSGNVPLFSKYGVEAEIEKTYNRRVPLPSGGYLIIEQTEALVAIDVNSGKFTDEEDLEDTALKTNLEAAAEIARQLRLRDLGGVIVNDFIDMCVENNRREVERAFKAALRRDRAKCWVSRISRFGIIEMTRQRMRPSLERALFEPCEHCRGTGIVKAPRVTGASILRQLRSAVSSRRKEIVEVTTGAAVQSHLLNERRHEICDLEERYRKTIVIHADPGYAPDRYTIRYR